MRPFLVLISLLATSAVGGACASNAPDPGSESLGQSRPPPAAASAGTIKLAAVALNVPTPSANSDEEDEGGGKPVSVSLNDPGGSGAYKFEPSQFTFTPGEKITYTLTAETEFHTFTVEELGVDVALDAKQQRNFTFTFSKAGTYKLICIPHRALGMSGTITVR